ncbi:DUF3618 domain-containing protein [uncultured Roseobacter sp.]|uniref:DUF3618 domain-containing protein n=1 Tax=uncultured Roseobacter sp. TaxID=114847 RepID=UPI00261050D9|nr:DUF3618 domain-containing protein [uncultured Roseobacter sp.]
MTNETRSPKEIEREIEDQRSDLTSNLEDLQDKFSLDTIVRQISDQFREHGGDMGRSISNQVKANPIPLALTGIGLAWLIFGDSQQPQPRHRASDDLDDDRYSSAEGEFHRNRAERGMPYTPPKTLSTRSSSEPSWARDHDDEDSPSVANRLSSSAEAVKDKAADGAQSVKGGLASAGSALGDAASSAKSTAGTATQSVKQGLATVRHRIAEGTETLTEEGRKRVIAARQKAVEMRRSAARSMHQGTDAAVDFYDQQPLVVGALALAVGAALGGALPRTKAEDDLMGAQSDSLYDEAERILEEEKAKALSIAGSVKDEVKDIAAETKADMDSGAPGDKSAVEAIGDKAKNAAERVAKTAKSEAQDKNLGKPKS